MSWLHTFAWVVIVTTTSCAANCLTDASFFFSERESGGKLELECPPVLTTARPGMGGENVLEIGHGASQQSLELEQ